MMPEDMMPEDMMPEDGLPKDAELLEQAVIESLSKDSERAAMFQSLDARVARGELDPEQAQAFEEMRLLAKLLSLWTVPALPQDQRQSLTDAVLVESEMASLLTLNRVPPPDPERWFGLKSRVLAATQGQVSESNEPAPAAMVLAPSRRPFAGWLVRLAAALLLILSGVWVSHLWHDRPLSRSQLVSWQQKAHEAMIQGHWKQAEASLQSVVQAGSRRRDCHDLVTSSLLELEAVRRYQSLSTGGSRREQLKIFIYEFPGTQITPLALLEYDRLSKKGATLKDFEDFPKPDRSATVLRRNLRQNDYLTFIKSPEPWLRDAARLQKALLDLKSGELEQARRTLELIHGRSPAAREAQIRLEKLDLKKTQRSR